MSGEYLREMRVSGGKAAVSQRLSRRQALSDIADARSTSELKSGIIRPEEEDGGTTRAWKDTGKSAMYFSRSRYVFFRATAMRTTPRLIARVARVARS